MSQPPITIVRITDWEMRQKFNNGRYHERTLSGELIEVVVKNRHPSLPLAKEPFCTRSQEVSYRDPATNNEVARCHQYLRKDGTIGLSGKPDPKRLYENGTLYRLVKSPAQEEAQSNSDSKSTPSITT